MVVVNLEAIVTLSRNKNLPSDAFNDEGNGEFIATGMNSLEGKPNKEFPDLRIVGIKDLEFLSQFLAHSSTLRRLFSQSSMTIWMDRLR